MSDRFFDSNILLYLAAQDTAKAEVVERLIADGGVISVQVLNEVANVARRKMHLGAEETGDFLTLLRRLLRVTPLTEETHDLGMALAWDYGFSTWDSMIVAAALLADCNEVLSEDMQHGLRVRGELTIVNPFRMTAPL